LLHPYNQFFLTAPRSKLLPGLFPGRRRVTVWVVFLALTIGMTWWVLRGWHSTVMLTAPSGVYREAQVERLWTERNLETTYFVSYSYAPFHNDQLVHGRDQVSRSVHGSLIQGGTVRICYALREPTFSRAYPNCDDPPIFSSFFLLYWVSTWLIFVVKDESLRRGRLLPGEILEASGSKSEEQFFLRVKYRFSTPKGRSITARARYTRNDLGNDPSQLPLPGTPILVQYNAAFHHPI